MSFLTIKTLLLLLIAIAGVTTVYLLNFEGHKQIILRPDNVAVVSHGRLIYSEHCAGCHGDQLEGQPNWRQRDEEGYLPAPPHDASGHTWHHSDRQLFDLTKRGLGATLGDKNFKTRMPAYGDQLSDSEILAVLSYIKSTWPAEIQSRHDRLNAARRSQ